MPPKFILDTIIIPIPPGKKRGRKPDPALAERDQRIFVRKENGENLDDVIEDEVGNNRISPENNAEYKKGVKKRIKKLNTK